MEYLRKHLDRVKISLHWEQCFRVNYLITTHYSKLYQRVLPKRQPGDLWAPLANKSLFMLFYFLRLKSLDLVCMKQLDKKVRQSQGYCNMVVDHPG